MVEIGCIFTIKIHALSTPFGVRSCPLFKFPLYLKKCSVQSLLIFNRKKKSYFLYQSPLESGCAIHLKEWNGLIQGYKYAPRLTENSQWFWKRKFLVEWQSVVIYLFLKWNAAFYFDNSAPYWICFYSILQIHVHKVVHWLD